MGREAQQAHAGNVREGFASVQEKVWLGQSRVREAKKPYLREALDTNGPITQFTIDTSLPK